MGRHKLTGRVIHLSQPQTRHILSAILIFLIPISALPQVIQENKFRTEYELISSLLKNSQEQLTAAQILIDNNRSLITIHLWETIVGKAVVANYFNNIEQSLPIYKIALLVAERLGDKRKIASTQFYIGRIYFELGKFSDAIKYYLESEKIYVTEGLQRNLIYVFSDLGSIYFYIQQYNLARVYSEKSIALASTANEGSDEYEHLLCQSGVAGAFSTLGALSHREGRYEKAISEFQKSNEVYLRIDKGSLKLAYNIADNFASLGRIYRSTGDHMQALILFNKALNVARKLPKRNTYGNTLNSLGLLYLEQEDYLKATDYFIRSLQAYQSQYNQAEIAMVLSNLGVVFQRQNQYEQALDYFRKAEQKAKENLDNDVVITAKQGIGAINRVLGNYRAALEVLDSGLSMAKELDDKIRIAEVLWRKAEVFYSMEDFDQTAILAEESFRLAQLLRQSNLSCYAATLLGKAQLKLKKPDLAFQTLSRAIDQIEEMRDRIAGQEQEVQLYFENKVDSYRTMVEFLSEENRPFDALLFSERAKGRVLFDVIRKGRIDITKSMTEKEKEEERRLNHLIVGLNTQLRNEQSKQSRNAVRVSEIQEQLDSARLQYSSFQNLLFASHPKLKAQRGQVPALDPYALLGLKESYQTAFLAYQVTGKKVYLFVLTSNDQRPVMELKAFTIPVKEEDLRRRVIILHDAIAGHRLTFAALSREIHDLLIKPAEQLLRGKTIICVIPDGILWEVPFQALMPSAGRYLAEDYAIHYAPSLSVLIEMAKRKVPASSPSPGSLLALGNPFVGSQTIRQLQEQQRDEAFEPLPAAEIEVNRLSDIFSQKRSKILTGAQAEEKVFKSLSPVFNKIHLATHGILDNRHPLYSYLLLSKRDDDPSEDGMLEAREILNLDLRAELAVLSACETARGKIGSGEGVIGMSWAFFVAGCRTTIVSQWKVNSAGTSALMINFYKYLEQSNTVKSLSKAAALRLAALSLMKDRRYQHPFYWAGFVLIGSNE